MPSFQKTLVALLLTLTTLTTALPTPQLAGEGQAADSIFSSTDNGVGFGIEGAEENLANNIASIKGGSGTATGGSTGGSTGGANPPPPPPPHRRQLDKIAKGMQTVGNAAGVGDSTEGTTNMLVDVDGELTSGAANLGAEIGNTEESTLISLGKSVPRV
jgi:hypothetical protein